MAPFLEIQAIASPTSRYIHLGTCSNRTPSGFASNQVSVLFGPALNLTSRFVDVWTSWLRLKLLSQVQPRVEHHLETDLKHVQRTFSREYQSLTTTKSCEDRVSVYIMMGICCCTLKVKLCDAGMLVDFGLRLPKRNTESTSAPFTSRSLETFQHRNMPTSASALSEHEINYGERSDLVSLGTSVLSGG